MILSVRGDLDRAVARGPLANELAELRIHEHTERGDNDSVKKDDKTS